MDQIALDRNRAHSPVRPRFALACLTMATAAAFGPALVADDQPKARLAAKSSEIVDPNKVRDISPASKGLVRSAATEVEPTAAAKLMIAECKQKYAAVQDYTCTFFKRERMDGKLSDVNIMTMKARTKPVSIYFKFIQPYAGREAIYVKGRDKDKIVAHESGVTKVLAGTMHLDPKGDMAMEDNRHPVTEAGIGMMIDTVIKRWEAELIPGVTRIVFHPQARVGERACTMIETIHDAAKEKCSFATVRLYIDHELGLPIRFEGYDWPKKPGMAPELLEEYTYLNLKLNQGLKDRDFDPKNAAYSYGRF